MTAHSVEGLTESLRYLENDCEGYEFVRFDIVDPADHPSLHRQIDYEDERLAD